MNEGEAETYENLFERIRADVEQAEKEIHETKIELEKARKIRRNRMEYDALAKVIFVSIYNMGRHIPFSVCHSLHFVLICEFFSK